MRRILTFILLMLSSSAWSKELPVVAGVSLELAQYRAANISNVNYRLALDVPADVSADITGNVQITFDLASMAQPVQLDFREEQEKLRDLHCNGREIKIDFRNEHLVLPVSALKMGANTVQIGFVAGSASLNRNPDYLYTLFVPDRARTAFPLFDQPDLKARYDLTLDVPAGWVALGNAPVTAVTEQGDKSRYEFATSNPISSYLFAFAAGEFEAITRTVDGRTMTMLHRETDPDKIARNVEAIFEQHASSLAWLERYTDIDYPFQKLDFALVPSFQYGGMEHVGAILYRADNLLLEENPTDAELLNRGSLIAHETAHMWFGNLVTMAWFNDVWTKEVFANFMAAKIVNPLFPGIDHPLGFLIAHYPGAYAVDRTAGANAIRQHLPNLAEAGQMYGNIIYDKAPIMMRQLELIIGEAGFREGLQEYLRTYAHSNATWPGLVSILDRKTPVDLKTWSEVWVNTAGRPRFDVATAGDDGPLLEQQDLSGLGRVWPQRFAVRELGDQSPAGQTLESVTASIPWPLKVGNDTPPVIFNSDGMGYGLFPARFEILTKWTDLSDLEKGSVLIDLRENMLEPGNIQPAEYLQALIGILELEESQLLLGLALNQAVDTLQTLLSPRQQATHRVPLEHALWRAIEGASDGGTARLFFEAWSSIASSPDQIDSLNKLWAGEITLEALQLSEKDTTRLAEILAIRQPLLAKKIIAAQRARIENPDSRRRLDFVAPSLAEDVAIRDAFFDSLALEANRLTESWVLDGLSNLHHPSRTGDSQKYLGQTLELLQEIQVTGDIFFPTNWLTSSFSNHNSDQAVATVRDFLNENPDYNKQLRMKILQAADKPTRANRILSKSIK